MHPSGVGSKLTRHMLIELTKTDKQLSDDLNSKTSFGGHFSSFTHLACPLWSLSTLQLTRMSEQNTQEQVPTEHIFKTTDANVQTLCNQCANAVQICFFVKRTERRLFYTKATEESFVFVVSLSLSDCVPVVGSETELPLKCKCNLCVLCPTSTLRRLWDFLVSVGSFWLKHRLQDLYHACRCVICFARVYRRKDLIDDFRK